MSKPKKVYVSGKISGLNLNEAKLKFFDATVELCGNNHIPVNPFDILPDCKGEPTWEDYMRADLKEMLDCDAVYALPCWKDSKGARIEVNLALSVGIPVYFNPQLV